jgi:hypothetical protein
MAAKKHQQNLENEMSPFNKQLGIKTQKLEYDPELSNDNSSFDLNRMDRNSPLSSSKQTSPNSQYAKKSLSQI